ncbi:MAG: RloB family protein [Anaerolineales bacterium]
MVHIRKLSGNKKTDFGGVRSSRDFARRENTRAHKKRILISCEGTKTEHLYFDALKDDKEFHNVILNLEPKGKPFSIKVFDSGSKADPVHVVEKAVKAQNDERKAGTWDSETDEVWCVLDIEQKGEDAKRHLPEAIRMAKQRGFKLAISNPCFEYWYLLHFERTDGEFLNYDELEKVLKRKDGFSNYDKAISVYHILKPRLKDVALKNSESLRKQNQNHWDAYRNPSTGVDILVREIIGSVQEN